MRSALLAAAITACALAACAQDPHAALPETAGTSSTRVPEPTGYVVDTADLLTPTDELRLTRRLAALDDTTTVQVAVVTVPALDGERIDALALRIARSWGIGQAEVNNGALVLLAAVDREAWVSTGLGLEWQVPDSVATVAVERMTERFRAGAFAEGLERGVDILAAHGASVSWDVAFATAAAAQAAGPGALGRLARFRGVWRGAKLETEAGPVALRFPPHWSGAFPPYTDGEPAAVVARVVSVSPFVAEVVGRTE